MHFLSLRANGVQLAQQRKAERVSRGNPVNNKVQHTAGTLIALNSALLRNDEFELSLMFVIAFICVMFFEIIFCLIFPSSFILYLFLYFFEYLFSF